MRCFGLQLARRAAGLALLAGAVGCGGKVAGKEANSEAPRAAPSASPPYASAPSQSTTPPRGTAPPAAPPPPITPGRAPPALELDKAAVENVLLANCGSCHGPALTPDQASAGINYINDIDRLVEVGLIVPLNTTESRLIQLMLDGSMPPVASGYPPVTDADISLVSNYIDNPRYWADGSPPAVAEVDAGVPAPALDAGVDGG